MEKLPLKKLEAIEEKKKKHLDFITRNAENYDIDMIRIDMKDQNLIHIIDMDDESEKPMAVFSIN